jgi:hypothetical protein
MITKVGPSKIKTETKMNLGLEHNILKHLEGYAEGQKYRKEQNKEIYNKMMTELDIVKKDLEKITRQIIIIERLATYFARVNYVEDNNDSI